MANTSAMKKLYLLIVIVLTALVAYAQPLMDTAVKLIAQKENIIKENTIVTVENLGDQINTGYPEMRPTVSADGNMLFFIRQGHPANVQIATVPIAQDIWYSVRDSLGKWSRAKHLNGNINVSHFNAVFWISPDMNTILLKGAFREGQYLGMGVSMMKMQEDGNWSPPQMLRIRNFEKFMRTAQFGACMGNDGNTMLFYMNPKEGEYGYNDLYVSFHEGGDIWTAPKSLGKHINTKDYDEMSPFLAADGKTLYFATDRPGGLGEMDIWMSKRLDESWTKWTAPKNLGAPINTEGSEAFFTMDAGGEYAYLTSSNGAFGASDIVRVKLMEQEMPDPVVLVTGNVYNAKTKQPLAADLIYEVLPEGKEAGKGSSNPSDGSFKIVLPFNKNYSIRASADKYFAISENLNLDSLIKQGYTIIHKDLYLAPIEIGQVFRLNNVFFDFDKFDLRSESFAELDRVVKFLNDYPNVEIELSAHTDAKGSDNYNFTLSDNRAKSVREYIIGKGIADARVISRGYGETVPVASNDNDEGRQLNRRVEFKILKN